MARFEALELAFELARALRALIAIIAEHDRELSCQLRREGTSVVSCLSEGAQRRGKDRLHLYRVSAGSAAEVRTQLLLAIAWGYLDEQAAAPAAALADRVVAVAWRLTHPRA
jgi:four helix bundle protein